MELINIEEWRDIEGFNGYYQISNTGKVKNKKRNILRKIFYTKNGYPFVTFCIKRKSTTRYIQRLVAEAFIPDFTPDKCITHIDGDKSNNNVNNLKIVTQDEVHKYASILGGKTGHKTIINGKVYATKKEALENRNIGLSYKGLMTRIHRDGWTKEEAYTIPVNIIGSKKKLFFYKGKYRKLKDIYRSSEHKTCWNTFETRIYRNWDIDMALSVPSGKGEYYESRV